MDQPAEKRMNSARRIVSGADFVKWRTSHSLSLAHVGDKLGVSKGTVQQMETTGLPQTQALAIAAINAGLEPWTPNTEGRE